MTPDTLLLELLRMIGTRFRTGLSPDRSRPEHQRRHRLLLLSTATTLACQVDGTPVAPKVSSPVNLPIPAAPFPGVVTEPLRATPTGATYTVVGMTSLDGHAFVAAPPGTYHGDGSALIENRRTRNATQASIVNGGFDPVPLRATEHDTLDVTANVNGVSASIRSVVVVPGRKRPVIVRTDPPPKKRDVPLNERLTIVFSEPIDPQTVTSATIRLSVNGTAVPGSLVQDAGSPWVVSFQPAAELLGAATYALTIEGAIRDLEGLELETTTAVEFTTAARPVELPFGGRLAFSRWNGATRSHEIVVVNVNGTSLQVLTDGLDPSWSPDGTRIAFTCTFDGGICLINADGSARVQVSGMGYHPTWSPDGDRIAFGCGGICVMNADGTSVVQLTSGVDAGCFRDSDPSWSTAGTIAFMRWPERFGVLDQCMTRSVAYNFPFDFWTEVWFVESDGSNLHPLEYEGAPLTYAGWPAWSPDGSQLAFFQAHYGHQSISIVDADGRGLRPVVLQIPPLWDAFLGGPDWSPDGLAIVFGSAREMRYVNADGSGGETKVMFPDGGGTGWGAVWTWTRR